MIKTNWNEKQYRHTHTVCVCLCCFYSHKSSRTTKFEEGTMTYFRHDLFQLLFALCWSTVSVLFCSTVQWTQIPCPSMSCTLSGTLWLRWENLFSFWALGHCIVSNIVSCQAVVIDWTFRVCCSSLFKQFLPTWLAPNLITFTGFMFLVLNFVMLAFYDFDFNASGKCSLLLEYCPLRLLNVALWIIFTF